MWVGFSPTEVGTGPPQLLLARNSSQSARNKRKGRRGSGGNLFVLPPSLLLYSLYTGGRRRGVVPALASLAIIQRPSSSVRTCCHLNPALFPLFAKPRSVCSNRQCESLRSFVLGRDRKPHPPTQAVSPSEIELSQCIKRANSPLSLDSRCPVMHANFESWL